MQFDDTVSEILSTGNPTWLAAVTNLSTISADSCKEVSLVHLIFPIVSGVVFFCCYFPTKFTHLFKVWKSGIFHIIIIIVVNYYILLIVVYYCCYLLLFYYYYYYYCRLTSDEGGSGIPELTSEESGTSPVALMP